MDDWLILGWGNETDSASSEWNQNIAKDITINTLRYAVASVTYTAQFIANGATLTPSENCNFVNSSNVECSCTRYLQEQSCSVITPSIHREGHEILGWNLTAEEEESAWFSEVRILESSETWFAITKVQKREIDIFLVVDMSGSITNTNALKLKNALASGPEYIEPLLMEDAIVRWTLIKFGSTSSLISRRVDGEAFQNSVLSDMGSPSGGTCTSCGLDNVLNILKETDTMGEIFVFTLTDGPANNIASGCSTLCESSLCTSYYGIGCYVNQIANRAYIIGKSISFAAVGIGASVSLTELEILGGETEEFALTSFMNISEVWDYLGELVT